MLSRFGWPVSATMLISVAVFAQTTTLHYYNIDDQTGWQSCSVCAGGQNSSSNYSGPVKVSAPSMDGSSAQFSLKNPWPTYANVLWWRNELAGGSDHNTIASLHNFVYDLYYYIKKPSFSQALEFDVTQTVCDGTCTSGTSTRYKYGTECNVQSTGTWRVWDPTVGWVNTGIRCSAPAYTWNHLVLQFQRTATNQVKYVSITVNGTTHYLNKVVNATPLSVQADDFNADFQMDGDFHGHPYVAWLDEINLTAW